MSTVTEAAWEHWRHVGCGVESLHHILAAAGAAPSLEDVLRESLGADGYDEELGWRHRALVATAGRHGLAGRIASGLDVATLFGSSERLWMVSVNAPEQFECTHLVAVDSRDGALNVFWPQGHPQFGEAFVADPAWLEPKMTGRGIAFSQASRRR